MKKFYWLIILSLIISCLFVFCSCGKEERLDAPRKLEVEMTSLTLKWREVKDARLYTISVTPLGADEGKEYIASKNYYSLSHLDPGEYTISVKANGREGVSRDSEWTESIRFEREHESGLAFTLINGGTEYEVSNKGTATGDIVIPDTYRTLPVTSIGERAFFNKSDVTSVTFGKNVKNISQFAFANCSYITELTLPDGLETIGASAFASCRLLAGELVIPEGIRVIPKNAFAYCVSLNSVVIGGSVETIEQNAFTDCSNLVSLFIPSSVKSIGEHAFAICGKLESISIAEGVEEIGPYAMSGLPLLTSIDLPNSVKIIGEGAFFDCEKLSSVTIGDAVEVMSLGAFNSTAFWDNSLTNEVYVGDWFLGLKDNTVAAVDIRSGVRGIASFALFHNRNVSSIKLPESVRIIGEGAFADSRIINVEIGSGVTEIGAQAFDSCTELSSVILGSFDFVAGTIKASSLKSIGSYAFRNCKKLDSIEMPETLETVGSYAFRDTGIYKSASGVVYAGSWVVDYNENITATVVLREGTVGIANYAFYKCETINSVKMPGSVKSIGRSAFYDCSALVEVELPLTLEVINDYTFYRCKNLKLFDLPPMLTYIGRSAFYKCGSSQLAAEDDSDSDTLIIPEDVVYVGDYAFYGVGYKEKAPIGTDAAYLYYGIDKLVLPLGLKHIGASAFYAIPSLREVDLGGTVSIGEKAFYKCESLVNVIFGDALETIGEKAFYKCEALPEIQLPSGVVTIGNYAFYKCASLSKVDLGGAEVIGDYAFYGDSSISSVTLPIGLKSIGKQAFRNCKALSSLVINESIDFIDQHAFYGCDKLTLYFDAESIPDGWSERWNSSYRPVVTGCTVSEDNSYVIYTDSKTDRVLNLNSKNFVSDPAREGYTFGGWGSSATATTPSYTSDDIAEAEGGRKLYAIWIEDVIN